MTVKGILFDFDGTLANTTDLIITTFQYACRSVLNIEPSREEVIATFGLPLGEALLKATGRADLVEKLRDVYREYNNAHHDSMIKPIAGVQEMLQGLQERGLKIAVVTSKKAPMLERGLNCLNLARYIDVRIPVGTAKRDKPYPDPCLAACEKLGLAPDECLCVGDSPFDLQSGHNAGTQTVAVRYSHFNWQRMLAEGKPDYIIDKPQSLLQIIDTINAKEA